MISALEAESLVSSAVLPKFDALWAGFFITTKTQNSNSSSNISGFTDEDGNADVQNSTLQPTYINLRGCTLRNHHGEHVNNLPSVMAQATLISHTKDVGGNEQIKQGKTPTALSCAVYTGGAYLMNYSPTVKSGLLSFDLTFVSCRITSLGGDDEVVQDYGIVSGEEAGAIGT